MTPLRNNASSPWIAVAFVVLTTLLIGRFARATDDGRSRNTERRPAARTPSSAPQSSQPFPVRFRQTSATEPITPARDSAKSTPLPLGPPSARGERNASESRSGAGRAVTTTISSLVIVVGVFLGIVWIARRGLPVGPRRLPQEVVESLGKTPLAARQDLHLIRLGRRLLLVCSTSNGVTTLAEVTDRDEVERLLQACRATSSPATSSAFREVLSQLDEPSSERTWDEPERRAAPVSLARAARSRSREVDDV